MRYVFSEVWESITRHRARTVATAFGVFWGIFMLTLLLGAGSGLRNATYKLYEGIAVNAIWIFTGRTTLPFEGLGEGRELDLQIEDLEAMSEGLPGVEHLTPRAALSNATVRRGMRAAALPIYGVYPVFSRVEKIHALRGRLLNELDVQRARPVAMIGVGARQLLFGASNPVGQEIVVGGVPLTVVGECFDPGPENERRHIYIPFSTMQRSFTGNSKIDLIIGTLSEGASAERVGPAIRKLLGARHRFDPKDEAALEVWFMSQEVARLKRLMLGIDAAIAAVGLGTLISGMVGVSNILFVSVRERAREFGVRRALGASARSILALVMAEALALGFFAGGLGLLAGLGIVQLMNTLKLESESFSAPHVDTGASLIALAVLVVTALIAGFFPAREAARMSPMEALRRE